MSAIKREYKIVKSGRMHKIIITGGGKVPDYLKGNYTPYTAAVRRLESHKAVRAAELNKALKAKKVIKAKKAD